MLKHDISDVFIESSMKLVFANALFNALLHGLLRRNYRKGFHYIARTVANVLCCGLISKPSGYISCSLYCGPYIMVIILWSLCCGHNVLVIMFWSLYSGHYVEAGRLFESFT